jgi:hypothetical protein
MSDIDKVIAAVRADRQLDPRTSVFEVRSERRNGAIALVGETTDRAAVRDLITRMTRIGKAPNDEVIQLPDEALGEVTTALVRVAVAPLYSKPQLASTMVSQVVLGTSLQLLSRREWWYRVRGQDSYIGWINQGFLATGSTEWARKWERGLDTGAVISLGAELVDDTRCVISRAPWGARLVKNDADLYQLPDGRTARIGRGELIRMSDLPTRFPLTGQSIVETAKRWLGTPYLWGGVTQAGVDCSGLVQAVYRVHGITMPRDSSLQAAIGSEIEPGSGFDQLRPGDLVFFTEVEECITHVAISLGGPRIIHSAVANGEVAMNDLSGGSVLEERLRSISTLARRVLPAA